MIRAFFAVAIVALLSGCTTSNSQTPQFSTAQAAHPANWTHNHWAEFAKNPDHCVTCHGSWKDPAAAGGISNTSCFTCHPKGPGHPAGWDAGLQHGRSAAMAAPSDSTGMAYCFKCHGNNLNVGLTGTSCQACHTKAPHPAKPWNNADPSKSTHFAAEPGQRARMHQVPRERGQLHRQTRDARPRWDGAWLLQQHHVPQQEHLEEVRDSIHPSPSVPTRNRHHNPRENAACNLDF